MKKFLIVTILICFATAQSYRIINEPESKHEDRDKIIEAECIRELNLDEKKYNQSITRKQYLDNLNNPDNELICLWACNTRKSVNKDLIGADSKTTLYNGISKWIEITVKAGFEANEFTNEDLVTRVESCNASEQSECEFFKCSKMHQRITPLILYNYIFKVKDTVFGWSG